MSFLLRMEALTRAILIILKLRWLGVGCLYLLQYVLREVGAFAHGVLGGLRMVKVGVGSMVALTTHEKHHIVLTVQSIYVLVVALADGTSSISGVRLSRSTNEKKEVNID